MIFNVKKASSHVWIKLSSSLAPSEFCFHIYIYIVKISLIFNSLENLNKMNKILLVFILAQISFITCVKVSKFVEKEPCYVKDINRAKGIK